jgi:beta-glucuronidase
MSNETQPSKERDNAIKNLVELCRSIDSTRLITSAFSNVHYENSTAIFQDTVGKFMDIISVNEYLGWYRQWPGAAGDVTWKSDFDKPFLISEFGGEAKYGNKKRQSDSASSWSELYQEQIYKDQVLMFKKIPSLGGTCAWILADFRSPTRMHPIYQQGWNRKGLLSDRGEKKKAWYILKKYYSETAN